MKIKAVIKAKRNKRQMIMHSPPLSGKIGK